VVLVAATAWLDANGVNAVTAKQMYSTVRLPQLCPIYMVHMRNSKQDHAMTHHPLFKTLLDVYLASDADGRRRLEESSGPAASICCHWGKKRLPAPAVWKFEMVFSYSRVVTAATGAINQRHNVHGSHSSAIVMATKKKCIGGVGWTCKLVATRSHQGPDLGRLYLFVTPSSPRPLLQLVLSNPHAKPFPRHFLQFEAVVSVKDGINEKQGCLTCGFAQSSTFWLWKDVELRDPLKQLAGLVKDSKIRLEVSIEVKPGVTVHVP
jgi:hypothetical protein